MNYPVWDVPGIGGPWVIGLISIFHVLIAWFAVGGGIYLPYAERKLYREGREDWIPVLQRHSRFFLVLTGVFGAVSGVGIWFAIGLVQPEATSTLIHNFVFGWAIEWVFFVIELAAAAVYYYTWNRIPRELHLKVGFLYAIASFLTLVIINGILSFMLTPGDDWLSVAGTGTEASKFWHAFFNPTYFPSLLMRTLACLSLAGIYALITYSRVEDEKLQDSKQAMVRWSANWLMPMVLLLPVGLVWMFLAMKPESREILQLGMNTIGSGQFTVVTRVSMLTVLTTITIAGVVYFFAYKYPRELSFGHAASLLFLAAIATSSTEFARETVRKPYVIQNHMYSNGIRLSDIDRFNREGFLTNSVWTPDSADPVELGKAMFRGQCVACHTQKGYRSMTKLLQGRDAKAVRLLLDTLHKPAPDSPYKKYMPPLVGTDEEVGYLAQYLTLLSQGPQNRVAVK
ncbi:MAG TPA: cytochrome ubiquinol oxidase subunit I [Fimbriimonadaceae bacterium]|nr:cytochrome ubiquinol oxidase subunit I [Fimbriimonadaceae bacterium]